MKQEYRTWLEGQKYEPGTIIAQIHRVGRVESYYGNLDDHFEKGTLQQVIDELTYSAADQRNNRTNPSKIEVDGNIRNNLASYKNAVVRYRKFLTGWERSDVEAPTVTNSTVLPVSARQENFTESADWQKFSLERDMQAMLRRNIAGLGGSLKIIDDGAERSVDSGFIDITCADEETGTIVVVELKADKADRRAIGQILGYMGDLSIEEDGKEIRGILVAHDFDKGARSAARIVPSLRLVKYAVSFKFESVD